uniref:GTPase Der n=1 Tax=Lygus hesperus TaxID=30085 RepID=A0A0A9YMC5_LYGHE
MFVVDVREGITALDEYFAKELRKWIGPSASIAGGDVAARVYKQYKVDGAFDVNTVRMYCSKQVLVIANKYDYGSDTVTENIDNLDDLHFPKSDVIAFSAIHRIGMGEYYQGLVQCMENALRSWDQVQSRLLEQIRRMEATTASSTQDAATRCESVSGDSADSTVNTDSTVSTDSTNSTVKKVVCKTIEHGTEDETIVESGTRDDGMGG